MNPTEYDLAELIDMLARETIGTDYAEMSTDPEDRQYVSYDDVKDADADVVRITRVDDGAWHYPLYSLIPGAYEA